MEDLTSKPQTFPFLDAEETVFFHTVASKYALGAMLMQRIDKVKVVAIQYAGSSLTKSERMYGTFEKEAAKVDFALQKCCHYLFESTFIVYGNHKASRAAFEKVNIYGRFAR